MARINLDEIARNTVIRHFGSTFRLPAIEDNHLLRVKFDTAGINIIMVYLALGLFHLPRLFSVTVNQAISIQRRTHLPPGHLKHMGFPVHLDFLTFQVAPRLLRLKTARIYRSHAHISPRVYIPRSLVIKHIVAFDGHRNRGRRINRLSEMGRHIFRVNHQLQLLVRQFVLTPDAPAVLNIVQNTCACIRIRRIHCLCRH